MIPLEKLFRIKAVIEYDIGSKRTWPIKSGYRPGFNFVRDKQTSGSIQLLDREELLKGDVAVGEVLFASEELLGNVTEGTPFSFFEGPNLIGSGTVLEVKGLVVTIHSETIRILLNELSNSSTSREQAAKVAREYCIAHDERNLIYLPKFDEIRIWKALEFIELFSAMLDKHTYLYSKIDLANFIEKNNWA